MAKNICTCSEKHKCEEYPHYVADADKSKIRCTMCNKPKIVENIANSKYKIV